MTGGCGRPVVVCREWRRQGRDAAPTTDAVAGLVLALVPPPPYYLAAVTAGGEASAEFTRRWRGEAGERLLGLGGAQQASRHMSLATGPGCPWSGPTASAPPPSCAHGPPIVWALRSCFWLRARRHRPSSGGSRGWPSSARCERGPGRGARLALAVARRLAAAWWMRVVSAPEGDPRACICAASLPARFRVGLRLRSDPLALPLARGPSGGAPRATHGDGLDREGAADPVGLDSGCALVWASQAAVCVRVWVCSGHSGAPVARAALGWVGVTTGARAAGTGRYRRAAVPARSARCSSLSLSLGLPAARGSAVVLLAVRPRAEVFPGCARVRPLLSIAVLLFCRASRARSPSEAAAADVWRICVTAWRPRRGRAAVTSESGRRSHRRAPRKAAAEHSRGLHGPSGWLSGLADLTGPQGPHGPHGPHRLHGLSASRVSQGSRAARASRGLTGITGLTWVTGWLARWPAD